MKPLLNHFLPFWADPLLADLDHALFLGRDPWTLLAWLNNRAAATMLCYHALHAMFAARAGRPSRAAVAA